MKTPASTKLPVNMNAPKIFDLCIAILGLVQGRLFV